MTITLYQNESDERVIDKTLTQGLQYTTVSILEPSSVTNPRLILASGTDVLTTYNYLYIDTFDRYYYIEDITMENGYIILTCRVDVLKSFSAEIKVCRCVTNRQENKYNLYLNDEKFSALQYQTQQILRFNSPFKKASEFVLVTQGG